MGAKIMKIKATHIGSLEHNALNDTYLLRVYHKIMHPNDKHTIISKDRYNLIVHELGLYRSRIQKYIDIHADLKKKLHEAEEMLEQESWIEIGE